MNPIYPNEEEIDWYNDTKCKGEERRNNLSYLDRNSKNNIWKPLVRLDASNTKHYFNRRCIHLSIYPSIFLAGSISC